MKKVILIAYSVLVSLFTIGQEAEKIKKDKPALIVEDNVQTKDIYKILKKYSYKSFYYSTSLKKFTKIQIKYSLNKYYLQSNHLK